MRCSVIILNWNGANMLRQFLPFLLPTAPDAEVVVADNGSTDDSEDAVREVAAVRWLPLGQNYGFAEGYNRAIASVDSEYVVLLNSDVQVSPHWLNTLLDYMDNHPTVAACQPKIRKWTPSLDTDTPRFEHAGAAGGHIDILGYPFCRGRVIDTVEEDYGQYDSTEICFWATGACMCIRTNIYKEVGGLDSDFFAHMEEIDLCWRLNARGYQVACVPAAVVYHVGGASLNYGNPRKTYLNFRNNLLMLYKNAPWYRLLWVLPVRCMMDYAAAANDLVHKRFANAQAIVKARLDFLRWLPKFAPKRSNNIRLTTITHIPTITNTSIVFKHYL